MRDSTAGVPVCSGVGLEGHREVKRWRRGLFVAFASLGKRVDQGLASRVVLVVLCVSYCFSSLMLEESTSFVLTPSTVCGVLVTGHTSDE